MINIKQMKDNFVVRRLILTVKLFTTQNVSASASALAYSTMLSIVPMCAVLFSIARGFGFSKYIEEWFRNLLSAQPQAADVIVDFVNSYLIHAKSGMILGVGIIFMLYSVGMLTRNVELSFNEIWHTPNRSNLMRTFTDYISVFFLLPIVIILMSGISLFLTTIIMESGYEDLLGPVMQVVVDIVPFFIMWMVFTLLFVFLPNTKVKFRCAIIPAFLASASMMALQFFYLHAQMFISNYNAIYGSFAALPLLLLWMQFSWMICLFCATLNYVNQNMEDYDYIASGKIVSHRYQLLLSIILLNIIAKRFANGEKACSDVELHKLSSVPLVAVREMLTQLVSCGVLTEVLSAKAGDASVYQPTTSTENLTVGMVVDRMESYGERSLNIPFKEMLDNNEKLKQVLKARYNYIDEMRNILITDL